MSDNISAKVSVKKVSNSHVSGADITSSRASEVNADVEIDEANENSVIKGAKIDLKNSNQSLQESEAAQEIFRELQTILEGLKTDKQPNNESEALEIIQGEFSNIQKEDSGRWDKLKSQISILKQQMMSPERHLTAGKATLAEIAKHYLEDSLLAKAVITYLDAFSADME
jgi:hypothetical protein